MDALQTALVFALPIAAGALTADCMVPHGGASRTSLVAGYGLLLGLLLATLILQGLDSIEVSFTQRGFIVAALGVTCVAALLQRVCARRSPVASHAAPTPGAPVTWLQVAILAGLGLLLVARLFLTGYELSQRPMFAWDATMHWATKARVWFEHRELVPFVDNQQWLWQREPRAYTDHHPDYPATLPLLQVWAALAIDRWSDSLVNLPILALPVALAAILYAGGRQCQVPAFTAAVFTYLALSLPLLNIHVAVAGNADLLLGVTYAGALVSLQLWSQRRGTGMLILTLLLALMCTRIKNEGLFWALTLLPGVAVALLTWRVSVAILLTMLLVGAALVVLIPADWVIANQRIGDLALAYRPEVPQRLIALFAATESWHLLAFIGAALPVAVLAGGRRAKGMIAPAAALAVATLFYLVLYLFTRHSYGAIHFSSAGRVALHLVPGTLYLAMLAWHLLRSRSRSPSA